MSSFYISVIFSFTFNEVVYTQIDTRICMYACVRVYESMCAGTGNTFKFIKEVGAQYTWCRVCSHWQTAGVIFHCWSFP